MPEPLDRSYLKRVRTGLNAAFARAGEEPLDPANDRIAIFSDQHKGIGDQADDFRRCEHAYSAALGYYLEAGYRLFVLGDAEELWEEHAEDVIERYGDVLELEASFNRSGSGLERFYGNHDDQWTSEAEVAKHLHGVLGSNIVVREGLRLLVDRPGRAQATLFFVHGHQGTLDSDRWRWLSRLFVRYIWRPIQRRTGFTATTPARDYALRAKHDRAMLEWARVDKPGVVLIAGHTHRPVFARSVPDPPVTRPVAELKAELARALAAGDPQAAAAVHAELEYALTWERRPRPAVTVTPPCYFNTGCCSFPDGDITGLEIADREIRLVRWPGNLRELTPADAGLDVGRRVLVAEPLEDILSAVCDGPGPPARLEELSIKPATRP